MAGPSIGDVSGGGYGDCMKTHRGQIRPCPPGRGWRPTTAAWLVLVIIVIVVVPAANGFVPPLQDDNNDTSWEPVDQFRRRLGMAYNYTPSLIHPELCRYLTPGECRHADESLQEHGRKMRRLRKQTGSTLEFVNSDDTNESQNGNGNNNRQLNPSIGVVKVLVLLINFPDHNGVRTLIDPSVYDHMWNGKGKSDVIPSGSIARWFQLNSYGLYEIEAAIVPWTEADNTELYYSFGTSGLSLDAQKLFWPALDRLDESGIDWSLYDVDQDGTLDAVVALHSGYAAELKGEDCYTQRDYQSRIWSHAFASSFDAWTSADGRYRVGGYVLASAFRDRCGSEPARIGTMTHEFMHTFGLVDLYDGQDAQVGRGIGAFDIMATPYGPKDDPSWCGHLSAWSRIAAEWLEPIEILEDGQYSIQASELSNQAYVIRKPYPFMEYLLIENRQPLWFDARLWTGGMVVYHIDDRAPLQLKRGYPGQEGWPRNGVRAPCILHFPGCICIIQGLGSLILCFFAFHSPTPPNQAHYQVAVLGADGRYNLERGDNVGDVGDFWLEGMSLGPGNGRVFPNTDAYQFGSIRSTGITIHDIRKDDTIMTFRVSGLTETAAPTYLNPPTAAPTMAPLPNDETVSPAAPDMEYPFIPEGGDSTSVFVAAESESGAMSRFSGSAVSFWTGIPLLIGVVYIGR